MKGLTVIFPYYENAGMLQKQLEVFNAYPKDIRKRLELIVVDDGSGLGKRAEEAIKERGLSWNGFEFRLYRILTDLRWNWLQARNLGAKEAANDWLLLTDIDHVIPEKSMRIIIDMEPAPGNFYTFTRVNYPGNDPYHPHPNSYLMRKKFYWKVGGYDETFAGHYGTDGMYRRRCEEQGSHAVLANCPIARVPREVIPDASTTTLERKTGRDPNALDDVRDYKKKHGIGIQTLRFPWKRII